MKVRNFLWVVGGLCAAAAGLLVWSPKRGGQPVAELAHQLEDAWSEHHTVA